MALSTSISLSLVAALTKVLDLSTPLSQLEIKRPYTWQTGVGLNQADVIFTDTRTITASSTDSLDLIGGGLLDALGTAFAPARIKLLYVAAALANVNNVNVTRPATNGVPLFLAASDGIPVRPGGAFLWMAPDATGVAVTAGTGDLIDIINSAGGTSVVYDIVIIGASA